MEDSEEFEPLIGSLADTPGRTKHQVQNVQVYAASDRPKRIAAAFAALSAATMMAGFVVLGKHFVGSTNNGGDPGALLICRQAIAAPTFLMLARIWHGPAKPLVSDYLLLLELSFLHFSNALLFVWGIRFTSAFIASVMQLCIPVYALIYARLWGNEVVSFANFVGIIVTITGCALVTAGAYDGDAFMSRGKGPRQFSLGLVVLMVQCMCFVKILNLQKTLMNRYELVWVLAWAYGLSSIWTLTGAVIDGSHKHLGDILHNYHGQVLIAYSVRTKYSPFVLSIILS